MFRIRAWSRFAELYGHLENVLHEWRHLLYSSSHLGSAHLSMPQHQETYASRLAYVVWLLEQTELAARYYWRMVAVYHLQLHGKVRQRFLRQCRIRTRKVLFAICNHQLWDL